MYYFSVPNFSVSPLDPYYCDMVPANAELVRRQCASMFDIVLKNIIEREIHDYRIYVLLSNK